MRMRRICQFAIAALATLALCVPAAGAARLALVIGNDAYLFVRPLGNAAEDARAIGNALKSPEMGFAHVAVAVNQSQSQMKALIRDLAAKVSGGDEVVVYFAGHGVQIAGVSYLLPIDIHDEDAAQIRDDAVELQRVLDDVAERRPRFTLVVVDACRDNPFSGKVRAAGTRGLAPTTPADGQMVIYSAGANQKALDRLNDDDRVPNGLFTRVWLTEIQKSGVPVHEMARVVREEVKRQAARVGHAQVPALYDQSTGRFFFKVGESGTTKPRPADPEPVAAPAPAPTPAPVPVPVPVATIDDPLPKGRTFRDCESCPEMVVIPGGEFEMGSRDGEGDEDEHPIHRVRIRSFAMGKFEVTQGQWRALMGTQPSGFRRCGEDCPVEEISWDDAKAFLARLNQKVAGRKDGPYRLASEAEWEYACRGGSHETYCGGNHADAVAWFNGNSAEKTHPVGKKAPNRFGLHDMSGNVSEWVEDCWNENYRGVPADGTAWSPAGCQRRVVRGGAWFNEMANVRSADRSGDHPTRHDLYWGLRIAKSLP